MARGTIISDATWNYVALAVTALVGAGVNFALAKLAGPETLGVFAQLYAIYVIAAQLAVFGVHDSTQKHVAELLHKGDDHRPSVGAALLLALGTSCTVAALLVAASWPIGAIVDSKAVQAGIWSIAPGVVFFSINKVLFATLNGQSRLRAYAAGQILRAVFILGALIGFLAWDLQDPLVGAIFTAAEIALLPVLLAIVRPPLRAAIPGAHSSEWLRAHSSYGGRGLVNSLLGEAHIRIDVLMLSVFLSDTRVGIYSFAALFAEGLYQVPTVVRTILYPRLVSLITAGNRGEVAALVRKAAGAGLGMSAAVAGVTVLLFPYVAPFFNERFASEAMPVLMVLMGGMTVYAAFVPYDQLFLQSGRPGLQSTFMILNVVANIALNAVFIPRWGLIGAAAATAISFSFAGLLLLLGSWRYLGYRRTVLLHTGS